MTDGYETIVQRRSLNNVQGTHPKLVKHEYLWIVIAKKQVATDNKEYWFLQTENPRGLKIGQAYSCDIGLEHYIGSEERLMKVWKATIFIQSNNQARLLKIKATE